METDKIKIVLVDDSKVFREAMRLFLIHQLNCEIIGEAEDGYEFLRLMLDIGFQADIVIIDIEMPLINGIEATKKWCFMHPATNTIAVTMYTNKAYLIQLIESGFKGCVFKTDFFNEILKAIETVLSGKYYFKEDLPMDNRK